HRVVLSGLTLRGPHDGVDPSGGRHLVARDWRGRRALDRETISLPARSTKCAYLSLKRAGASNELFFPLRQDALAVALQEVERSWGAPRSHQLGWRRAPGGLHGCALCLV